MTEYVLICATALVASGLTLFSGFGLGTLLLPVFALFFSPEIAVAMTAVVHLANNMVKLVILGRHADRTVVRRFAPAAVLASLLGAGTLVKLSGNEPLATYVLGNAERGITPIGLAMGVVIAAFAIWETVPRLARIAFDPKYLAVGGALSGFFGGLAGHQGALRSAFLIRCGLTKEAFIGSGVVIAVLVDVARLVVYGSGIRTGVLDAPWALSGAAVLSATAGTIIAARLLPSVPMRAVRRWVAVLLFAMAALLGAGLV